uniref:Testis associated actin remodelling kinase 1 n=1 Tax=Neolamprologus brichardi TaxID=32507 RepID=A0A3Q4GR48_NEOBR
MCHHPKYVAVRCEMAPRHMMGFFLMPLWHPEPSGAPRPSSYRALRSAVSTLARLDDFSREKIVTAFFSVQHRVSGQVMALKMNILASNRANMLREVQLMNRLSHPNILSDSCDLCPSVQNCLVRWEGAVCSAVVGDFGLAEKIPDYRSEPLAVVGSPYWMAPEVLRGEVYNEKVDVFAYGIILCEIIARIQADPDILPRTEDFGLDVEAFRHMVADCPSHFLNLAIACCNMNAKLRPSFSQIVAELEKKQAERKQKAEPAVKELGLTSRLSRSKSDMLHPSETPPTATLAPPARFNPFSQREDLKGGKIKLFDTPSKSVISLTFTLPPPPDCDDTTASDADAVDMPRRHRRCHSLPCTPPPHLTSAPNTVLSEESPSETEVNEATEEDGLLEEKDAYRASDSGLPLSLEALSVNMFDHEKEAEQQQEEEGREEEPMDCTSSPDMQDSTSSPYSKLSSPPSHFSSPLQPSSPALSNGWGSAISNGPPCLPPLSSLVNNNVVVSRPLGWSTATNSTPTTNNNGYHSPTGDPAGSSPFGSGSGHSLDQEEVISSCPGCCLAGLRFPSVCLRAPPRRNPYKNLNGDHAASHGLLCSGPKGLPPSPTPTTTTTSLEPGLALPGVQT